MLGTLGIVPQAPREEAVERRYMGKECNLVGSLFKVSITVAKLREEGVNKRGDGDRARRGR